MKRTPPRDVNDVLVHLYGISQTKPIEQFQSAALALFKPVLTFDAAIWGAGLTTDTGIDIDSFHLHNKSPDMVAAYEEVKHLDVSTTRIYTHVLKVAAGCTSSPLDSLSSLMLD